MVSLNPIGASMVQPGVAASPYAAGLLYPPTLHSFTIASGAMSAGLLYALPFFCRETHTFTGISIYQSGAGTTGNFRLGVYSTTAARPTTLFQDGGAVACPGSTGWRTVSTSISLVQGTWYWLAAVADAAITVSYISEATGDIPAGSRFINEFGAIPTVAPDVFAQAHGFVGTHAYAALPTPFPTITGYTGGAVIPAVFLMG